MPQGLLRGEVPARRLLAKAPGRFTRDWVSCISTHRVSIRPSRPSPDAVSRLAPASRDSPVRILQSTCRHPRLGGPASTVSHSYPHGLMCATVGDSLPTSCSAAETQISQLSTDKCSSYRLALSYSPVPRIVRQRTRCDVRAPRTRAAPGWLHVPPAQRTPPPPPPRKPCVKPRWHWNFPLPPMYVSPHTRHLSTRGGRNKTSAWQGSCWGVHLVRKTLVPNVMHLPCAYHPCPPSFMCLSLNHNG